MLITSAVVTFDSADFHFAVFLSAIICVCFDGKPLLRGAFVVYSDAREHKSFKPLFKVYSTGSISASELQITHLLSQ